MKISNYEIEVNQDGTLNYNGSIDLAGNVRKLYLDF